MKKNVIVLGDSFIFGTGLADVEQRSATIPELTVQVIPELIAQPSDYTWVSSLAKDAADQASIVNLSMPGMDNLGLVSGLCNHLDNNPVRPDVIIFNSCPPDRFLLQASRTQDLIDYESLRNPGVAVPKNLTTDTTLLTKMINLKDSSKARNWKIFFNGFVGLLGTIEHSDSVLSEKHKKTLVDFRNEIYHPAMGTQAALSAMMSTWLIAKTLNAEFYWMANNSDVENMSLLPTEVLAESKTRRFPHVSILAQTAKYRTRCGHTNEAGHDSYYNDIVKPLFINLGIIHA